MAELHELLAVEPDLAGTYAKILGETKANFTKLKDRYSGSIKRVEFVDESAMKEADEHKQLDDTVPNKLDYTAEHIIRYLDAVLQKEATNMSATDDIIVDGVKIAENVPATFLLGLEKKLKKIRDEVYATIPTLQPGIKWEKDESMGEHVYKRVHPEENYRTKKIRKNHVLYEATDHHPAQVEMFTEDERIAKVVTDHWCGMIYPAEKSAILVRIDKLMRAVKKARQRANKTEVIERTIGKEIFDYINGVK